MNEYECFLMKIDPCYRDSYIIYMNFIAEANIMYPLKVLNVEGKIKNFKLDQ